MKIAVLLVLFAAMGGSAFAQGFRFDATVTQQGTIAGVTNAVVIPANPQIAFCNFPANATPCTNKATTYTSQTLVTPCSTSTQIVLTGTSSCVASPDAQDNWGVWVPAGMYSYTVTLPGGVNLGPYAIALFPPNANYAFTGNNTHSGVETFTGPVTTGIFNSMLVIDGVKYATIAAAAAAAGTNNPTIILIPSTYAGTECGANSQTNIIYWDFRAGGRVGGGNSTFICQSNTLQFGPKTSGLTDTMLRAEMQRSTVDGGASPGGQAAIYSIAHLLNGTINGTDVNPGATLDGAATESQLNGTWTATHLVMQGVETDVLINTSGAAGTVNVASGVQAYVTSTAGATTSVTNAHGVNALGCANMGAGFAPVVNCFALYGQEQLAKASSRNYALGFEGLGLGLYSSSQALAGFDFEDNAHATHHVFYNDSSNNLILQATSAASGLLLEDSAAANHLRVKSTGVDIFTSIHPTSAGGAILGTTAIPVGTIQFGTAATNNWAITPVALAAAHTLSYPDPGTQTTLTPGLSYNSTIGYYVSKRATAGCTTAASIGGICATPITVTWGPTLPNTNYSVVCTPNGAPTALPSNPYTITKTATTVTVNYYANSAVAASWPTVDCMAILD